MGFIRTRPQEMTKQLIRTSNTVEVLKRKPAGYELKICTPTEYKMVHLITTAIMLEFFFTKFIINSNEFNH